jgi:Family of unknown function (DUF6011)
MTTTTVNRIKIALDKAKENKVSYPMMYVGNYFFSLAPDNGKWPGSVYIKRVRVDGKEKFYLGKITPDGSIHLVPSVFGTIPEITADIVAIMDNPYTLIKAHGKKTGICSCCGRTLTNKLSIRLGIGPICREKYGFSDIYDTDMDEISEQPDLLDL